MDKILNNSAIRGFVFSVHDELGPHPIYSYPDIVGDEEAKKIAEKDPHCLVMTYRDYMQISIKNLSLLITDEAIIKNEREYEDFNYFAIIPFPDFCLSSLTFFHFLKKVGSSTNIESAFSLFIDENKRNLLYYNYNQLKSLITEFFIEFDVLNREGFISQKQALPYFKELIEKVIDIERKPKIPFSSKKKLKTILAGLDDSGKTSFLLTIDRKFSKLLGLKPTRGASVQSIQALGSTLFLWDLGGQLNFRRKYIEKSNIYLFESDLIFYFIDIRNERRFEESLEYLRKIKTILIDDLEQSTPIVIILSKSDIDILETKSTQKNIKYLKHQISKILDKKNMEYYTTSIFEVTTVLRAFSAGISKLSPNREILTHILRDFANKSKSKVVLVLSNEGLVLGDYYSKYANKLTDVSNSKESIQDVFEITAPQFTMLFNIFNKFKALEKNEALFQLANSFIYVKKELLLENPIFILIMVDDIKKKQKIEGIYLDFLSKIKLLIEKFI